MNIELTSAEVATVKQALEAKHASLMNELVHTDSREYRGYLKDSLSAIETVQSKLPKPSA
jgi:hypothetical protein